MGESKPYSEGGTKSARERPSAEGPEEEATEECCLNMGRRKSREMMSSPSRWAKSNLAEIVIRHSPLERSSFRTASPSDRRPFSRIGREAQGDDGNVGAGLPSCAKRSESGPVLAAASPASGEAQGDDGNVGAASPVAWPGREAEVSYASRSTLCLSCSATSVATRSLTSLLASTAEADASAP